MSSGHAFLRHGGEAGRLIGLKDWSEHPLGPIETWPHQLTSLLSICLRSPLPMAIYWGKEKYTLYNDAYSILAGDRHPAAIGSSAQDFWRESWSTIGYQIDEVPDSLNGKRYRGVLLKLLRNGRLEDVYFNYTFSPLFDESESYTGFLATAEEMTDITLENRRNHVVDALAKQPVHTGSSQKVIDKSFQVFSKNDTDITYYNYYKVSVDQEKIESYDSSSINTNLESVFKKVLSTAKSGTMNSFSEDIQKVAVLPIFDTGNDQCCGLLVLGINKNLPYDRYYRSYFEKLANRIETNISQARAIRRETALENQRHDARKQLDAALMSGFIGIWSLDLVNNTVYLDEIMAKRFGLDPQEAALGIPFAELPKIIHTDDADWVEQKIEEHIASGEQFEAEYRVILADSSVRWVLSRARVVKNKQNVPISFPGVVIDITDRKTVEQELASSERMFKALFDSTIIAVAVADLKGQVHEANNTFLSLFGYTKKDIDAGFYSKMITPDSSKKVTKSIYEMLAASGEAEPTEKEYTHKDGHRIQTVVGAVMIPGSQNRFVAFILDISEQKQLRALNKAKDEFITIASHQLRTPATGVKQYLGMLLEGYAGDINDSQRKIVTTAYNSNERQLMIVNDLLNIAQADASEIELAKKSTNIGKMLREAIDEQAAKFTESKQTIRCDIPGTAVTLSCDPFYLRMVFENLIDNAHKYTPAGKDIHLKLTKQKNTVIVSVKDEGVGIRKADMPRLFQKFSRIVNPRSATAGGSGLGLYWVKKIIDLHEGSIEVYSTYKKGTEFVIKLPNNTNG